MAWNKKNNKSKNKNFNYKSKNQNKRQQLTSLAYNMGLVSQGLENKNSAVFESFNKGVQKATKPYVKKPLY